MAKDPDLNIVPPNVNPPPASAGKIDDVDIRLQGNTSEKQGEYDGIDDVDTAYWIACLEDAERAEHNWRNRGREIIQIYRNDGNVGKKGRAADRPKPFDPPSGLKRMTTSLTSPGLKIRTSHQYGA